MIILEINLTADSFYINYEEFKDVALTIPEPFNARFYINYEEFKDDWYKILSSCQTSFILTMRNLKLDSKYKPSTACNVLY